MGHREARRQFHLDEEGLPEGGDALTEEKGMKKGGAGGGCSEVKAPRPAGMWAGLRGKAEVGPRESGLDL